MPWASIIIQLRAGTSNNLFYYSFLEVDASIGSLKGPSSCDSLQTLSARHYPHIYRDETLAYISYMLIFSLYRPYARRTFH